MDLNSIFRPIFLEIASDKSTSKPTYLSPSVNSNGGNVVSEPTRNTPSCCVILGLSLLQPANKPIAATATRAMAVNFLNLNIVSSSNIHIHGLYISVYIVRNFTPIGNNIV